MIQNLISYAGIVPVFSTDRKKELNLETRNSNVSSHLLYVSIYKYILHDRTGKLKENQR